MMFFLKLSLLSLPCSQESASVSSTRIFGTGVNGLSLPESVLGSAQEAIFWVEAKACRPDSMDSRSIR
jgi:hypothetical protein